MSLAKPDVLVVGAGVAGFAAALSARRAGATVEVLSAHAGATSLSGGAWDVCSDLYASTDEIIRPLRTIAEEVETLVYEDPHHPYARLDAKATAVIDAAHALVLAALSIYRPLDLNSRGVLVATDLGLLRRTATAQDAVLDLASAGTLDTTAVLSLRGDRNTDARFLSASWTELMSIAQQSRNFAPLHIDFFNRKDDALLHPHEIAAIGDSEDGGARIAELIANAVRAETFGSVVMPPLLGYKRDDVRARMEKLVGLPLGEWVQPLAGPQGLRLARRIDEVLVAEGCARVDHEVKRVEPRTNGTLVHLVNGTTKQAGAVVLCTGKHLGGGLAMRGGELVESLSALPVYLDGRLQSLGSSADGRDPFLFFGNDPFAGGPGFRAGVGYDPTMRARDRRGEVAAPDLFVAGALLDGVEPSRDGTGLGCCATTGFVAGRNAATQAGRG